MTAPKCLGLICRELKYCADMGECCRLVGQEDSEVTAAPVMSITEELVADLEYRSNPSVFPVEVKPSIIRALLAERAELVKDRERLDWLIKESAQVVDMESIRSGWLYQLEWPAEGEHQREWYLSAREDIDAAMQAAQ